MTAWFDWAMKEVGHHEDPGNRGPVVQKYIDLAHCGIQGDPWCAIFVNAALEANNIPGTRSPSSQSFRHNDNFVPLTGPALGAIAVFWRMSRTSGLGHVGLYVSETVGYVNTLGGNEGDAVRIELLAKVAGQFGLIGYWWPKSRPMPTIGAIPYTSGSSVGGKVV
jgi:uncharacterized protein (TIGR02594 family)